MVRTINDVVDDLGFGWCQVRIMLFGGGLWFVGGELKFIMTASVVAIAEEYGLQPYHRALLATCVALGALSGNWLSVTSDGCGRRPPVVWALLGEFICGIALTRVDSALLIGCMFFTIAAIVGFGIPSLNTLLAEATPRTWRLTSAGAGQSCFVIGSLFATYLVSMYSPSLKLGPHWRNIVLLGRIPNAMLLFLSICPGFVESPHFWLVKGRRRVAEMTLEQMWRQNNRPDVSLAFNAHEEASNTSFGVGKALGIMLGSHFLLTSLVVGFTVLTINFVFYGSMYALPIVLQTMHTGIAPATVLLLALAGELVGLPFAVLIERWTGRRASFVVYLLGSGASSAAFVVGANALQADSSSTLGLILVNGGICAGKFFVSIGWLVTYTYISEVFPTVIRTSATGACMGIGRIGAVTSPWLFEHLFVMTGTFVSFFSALGVLSAINAVLVCLVFRETKGEDLQAYEPFGKTAKRADSTGSCCTGDDSGHVS